MSKLSKAATAQDAPKEHDIPVQAASPTQKAVIGREDIVTVCDVLQYASNTFGERPAARDARGDAEKTFASIHTDAKALAEGLVDLELLKPKDIVAMLHPTSYEWQLMHYACLTMGAIVAPLGTRITPENDPNGLLVASKALFAKDDQLDVVNWPDTSLPAVVIFSDKPRRRTAPEGTKFLSLDDVLKGRKTPDPKPVDREDDTSSNAEPRDKVEKARTEVAPDGGNAAVIDPQDVAIIMHTAGMKAVAITHANLIAALSGVDSLLGHHFREDDTVLNYLPLDHMFEYMFELAFFSRGIFAGYGSVKTLKTDLAAFKPSLMIGVPAFWETLHRVILNQVQRADEVERFALKAALKIQKAGIPGPNSVLLKAIPGITGGKLRLAVCAGGALKLEAQKYLTETLAAKVLPCYGLTEACGICTILRPEDSYSDGVGAVVPDLEIELVDVPDAEPSQSEIRIRGPAVTMSYYKPGCLNDGPCIQKSEWLYTGDLGQWNEHGTGTLSIIGRLKNQHPM